MSAYRRNQTSSQAPIIEPRYGTEYINPAQEPYHNDSIPSSDRRTVLPTYNDNGHKVTKGIQPAGESGRKGIHPWYFLNICFRSSCTASKWVNILWPVVPAAIAVHFVFSRSVRPRDHLLIFILNYIAMLPAANLLGFAGGELARKIPKVFGVIMETTLGSVVEIVLFTVLLAKHNPATRHNLIPVIKAAILGSILANLLLCLGLCFFVGGIRKIEQEFDEAVSEVGSGLLLVAGMGLLVPAAFWTAVGQAKHANSTTPSSRIDANVTTDVLSISRYTAILLLVAFFIYIFFQMTTHHGVYDDVLSRDETNDRDEQRDGVRPKLTFTECLIAVLICLACVTLHSIFLVLEIPFIVEDYHVRDSFVGLILVPLAEKAAEHISAIDEAWDDRMNFALAHVLGATIQTALLNAPLVVLVGWGLHKGMDLNFEVFMIVVLILAILVVGNFLRDGKSNYLEGALCVIVYLIIGVSTWYYPDPANDAT